MGFLKTVQPDTAINLRSKPLSQRFLSPGDIVIFNYSDGFPRLALVVEVQRGQGTFRSSTGKTLLACFKLTDTNPEVAAIVLARVYKNSRLASYKKVIKGMRAIFRPTSFRTYDLAKMTDLVEVMLDKQQLDG